MSTVEPGWFAWSGSVVESIYTLEVNSEERRQVEALTQFCEMLSIDTQESPNTISLDSFVPVHVGLLNHESNPDIMLLTPKHRPFYVMRYLLHA